MEQLNLVKKIIENTNHTIESIAEILSMDIEELQFNENNQANGKIPHYKILLLSDFLEKYSLTFEENLSSLSFSE